MSQKIVFMLLGDFNVKVERERKREREREREREYFQANNWTGGYPSE